MDEVEPDYGSFLDGRAAFDRGDFETALSFFRESLEDSIHFKTLELIGESLCRLGRAREAIVPLAAATALNRGSRPPCLLAEALAAIEDWMGAKDAAEEALKRTPSYGRARAVFDQAQKQLTNRST